MEEMVKEAFRGMELVVTDVEDIVLARWLDQYPKRNCHPKEALRAEYWLGDRTPVPLPELGSRPEHIPDCKFCEGRHGNWGKLRQKQILSGLHPDHMLPPEINWLSVQESHSLYRRSKPPSISCMPIPDSAYRA